MKKFILTVIMLVSFVPFMYAREIQKTNPLQKKINEFLQEVPKLSEKEISTRIGSICYDADLLQLNNQLILERMKENIEKRIKYHEERMENTYDYNSLAYGVGLGLTGIASLGIPYFIYRHWHAPANAEYNKEVKKLELQRKNVSESHHDGKTKIHGSDNMTIRELNTLKGFAGTADNACWGEVITGSGSLVMLVAAYYKLYDGLYPQHKKKYEQLCIVKEKIEKEISWCKKYSNKK